jgi:2-methylcitrate synthase
MTFARAAVGVAGRRAHIIETLEHNRLMRPSSKYTGPERKPFVPLRERR